MSFLNYIGGFFLFRWLFGSRKHDNHEYTPHPNNYDNRDYGYSQSYDDDYLDDQEDYDTMDDDYPDDHDDYDPLDDDF